MKKTQTTPSLIVAESGLLRMKPNQQHQQRHKSSYQTELTRDIYGFVIPPQHLQHYKTYIEIYKKEEEERSEKWTQFLERCSSNDSSLRIPRKFVNHNKVRTWSEIRPSVSFIERRLIVEKKKKNNKLVSLSNVSSFGSGKEKLAESFESDSDDNDFFDVEHSSDAVFDAASYDSSNSESVSISVSSSFRSGSDDCTWSEELEFLVRGGVPMSLRGEIWQAFVGSNARRVEGYYNSLLAQVYAGGEANDENGNSEGKCSVSIENDVVEKWSLQIEKDLPRTFPGHPALDGDGRNALRRLLTAYAYHDPSVGYCQAMNFIGGLLLLMMSEENAFWMLTCIMEDYFYGYYSEDMVEAQVDQLVFEEVVGQRFPKLVSHLDKLGIKVSLVTGPWFLSLFVNILPWESVLRVWDVLLYEGSRIMLFRTALALIDLHGPALIATREVGDTVSLFQSLAASTFDSSQLVMTACTGYKTLDEGMIQSLYESARQKIASAIQGRLTGNGCLRGSQAGLVFNDNVYISDLQDQVSFLKMELTRAVEETKAAVLRSKELHRIFTEYVTKDNSEDLAAKVMELESIVINLRHKVLVKETHEKTLLKVMMHLEQEQRTSEDARRVAEQVAMTQKHVAMALQEKYDQTISSLAAAKKRAFTAEGILEASIWNQEIQSKQDMDFLLKQRVSKAFNQKV